MQQNPVKASSQVEELRRVMQRLFRRFGALSAESTPCGKPLPMAHAHALMLLRAHGELSQRALAAELCIDKSNVTRLCAKLADSGHVQQRANATDGRSRLVALTPRGAQLAAEVDAASRARFAALLNGLPKLRRSETILALQRLVDALDAPEAALPSARISA
ncbi:MAG TPA: MarR family transcriptional regulator [Polyangiaceae bacterium]